MIVAIKNAVAESSISPEYTGPVALLGSENFSQVTLNSGLDVHAVLAYGLPRSILTRLILNTGLLHNQVYLQKAIGISPGTLRRYKAAPNALLSQEQSERAWKFADILSNATEVFGSQGVAEQWLTEPALALNQNRPIDLLSTHTGTEQVRKLLAQLEYCVYV